VQAAARTVQGELERALATICDEPVRIAGAGRTDAGVHAIGQVISFRTASALDGATLGRGVNALLPEDIAVSAVEACGKDFHARFSATGRTYEYRIRTGPTRDPLERWAYHLPAALEVEAMRAAGACLIGRHDVSAFASGPGGERHVRRADWSAEGDLLRFEIEADAFLHGMARAIVGTLLWVGRGRIGVDRFGEIVRSRERSQAGPNAPARGLCLTRVSYAEDPIRRTMTRARESH